MGARAAFEEDKKGMLREGMTADFVVLSQDIRKMPPRQISRAVVEQTYVDGRRVYDRLR